MKLRAICVASFGICCALSADSFLDTSSLKPKQSIALTPLDKTIMELKKESKDPNVGFFVDAKTGRVIGSSSANLPKSSIKNQVNKKATLAPRAPASGTASKKSDGVKYEMQVEKIPLMQGY